MCHVRQTLRHVMILAFSYKAFPFIRDKLKPQSYGAKPCTAIPNLVRSSHPQLSGHPGSMSIISMHCNRFYALFVLISLSSSSLAQSKELEDCQKQIKNISGALGFLLAVETIFCCYVLFTWYRNSRINLSRKERNSTDPEQGEGEYPMYTDIDEDNTQDQKQNSPKNGLLFGLSRPTGVVPRPVHQNQSAIEKKPGQRIFQRLMANQRNTKPKTVENPETTATSSNDQVLEADVGGLVYSEPYEDKVSVASELMSKNHGKNFGKIGKEPPPEEQKQLVYYHVLEESVEGAANAPASPVKPPPFPSNSKTREEVYYYCDSDNPDNKTAPPKPLPFASSKEPGEDDVYYSCVEEESASSPSKATPKKALLPFDRSFNESSPKATRSGLAAAQQNPHFHARENQKPELANKKALIPKNNPMMNAHMIQEMKNRVANKKSGN